MVPDEAIIPFDDLRRVRHDLRSYLRRNAESVWSFRAHDKPWFRLTIDEPDQYRELAHISTSATCLESLILAGEDSKPFQNVRDDFVLAVLQDRKWTSFGAAEVYSRVRTLPLVLTAGSQEVLAKHKHDVNTMLEEVWSDVSTAPGHQAIRERPIDEKSVIKLEYPPSPYHTYWAIRCIGLYQSRFGERPEVSDLGTKLDIVDLWSHQMLCRQIGLSVAGSDRFDAHQLASAIGIMLQRQGEALSSENLDLIRAGLNVFFEAQTSLGTWPRSQAMFHYPTAGNAYAYDFETLSELLKPASRREGRFLRELFRPYSSHLMRAVHYLKDTALLLDARQRAIGWCSGHHVNRTRAEAWATAIAYTFLQVLRAIVGHWARESAETELGVRLPDPADPIKAIKDLDDRGETWEAESRAPVSDVLAALFINPISSREQLDHADPDSTLLTKDNSRSAILFGPPGTSKTTLVECIAGALGWNYLEIHASSFVIDGMESVHQRADWIFSRLMELDRCVVLFDEIDELVREREDRDTQVYSRFLTTSMLPRIAELWKQGRILYFVATNSYKYFDFAIARNQRFDARLFVAPPSFRKKVKELIRYAEVKEIVGVNQDHVEKALRDDQGDLGLLALLRFDQLAELGKYLKDNKEGDAADRATLQDCLARFRARIMQTYPPEKFRGDRNRTDRDQQRIALIAFDQKLDQGLMGRELHCQHETKYYYPVDDPHSLKQVMSGNGWSADRTAPATYEIRKTPKATS